MVVFFAMLVFSQQMLSNTVLSNTVLSNAMRLTYRVSSKAFRSGFPPLLIFSLNKFSLLSNHYIISITPIIVQTFSIVGEKTNADMKIFLSFFRHKDIRPQRSDQERKHPFLHVIFAQFFCRFRVFFLRIICTGIASSAFRGCHK